MSDLTDNIQDLADGFDDMREDLLPENSRLFFLKRGQDKGSLIVVREITFGWFIEFDKFRGQMLIYLALFDANFTDDLTQTSFIGYGVPNVLNELDVFDINPDRRDVVPPTPAEPVWKVFVTRAPQERFVIP